MGSTTTSFLWSGGNVLDDGTQYVYGKGLVSHVTPGGTYYYLTDGSGSTVALVDSTGAVAQRYSYDAYGTVTASSGSQPTEYQYTGQQTDATGLQYLRARYYDPSIGRFLSRDPLSTGDPAGHQPYPYGGDNPATNSDPSGQDFFSDFQAFQGVQSAFSGSSLSSTAAAMGVAAGSLSGANAQYSQQTLAGLDGMTIQQIVGFLPDQYSAPIAFYNFVYDAFSPGVNSHVRRGAGGAGAAQGLYDLLTNNPSDPPSSTGTFQTSGYGDAQFAYVPSSLGDVRIQLRFFTGTGDATGTLDPAVDIQPPKGSGIRRFKVHFPENQSSGVPVLIPAYQPSGEPSEAGSGGGCAGARRRGRVGRRRGR